MSRLDGSSASVVLLLFVLLQLLTQGVLANPANAYRGQPETVGAYGPVVPGFDRNALSSYPGYRQEPQGDAFTTSSADDGDLDYARIAREFLQEMKERDDEEAASRNEYLYQSLPRYRDDAGRNAPNPASFNQPPGARAQPSYEYEHETLPGFTQQRPDQSYQPPVSTEQGPYEEYAQELPPGNYPTQVGFPSQSVHNQQGDTATPKLPVDTQSPGAEGRLPRGQLDTHKLPPSEASATPTGLLPGAINPAASAMPTKGEVSKPETSAPAGPMKSHDSTIPPKKSTSLTPLGHTSQTNGNHDRIGPGNYASSQSPSSSPGNQQGAHNTGSYRGSGFPQSSSTKDGQTSSTHNALGTPQQQGASNYPGHSVQTHPTGSPGVAKAPPALVPHEAPVAPQHQGTVSPPARPSTLPCDPAVAAGHKGTPRTDSLATSSSAGHTGRSAPPSVSPAGKATSPGLPGSPGFMDTDILKNPNIQKLINGDEQVLNMLVEYPNFDQYCQSELNKHPLWMHRFTPQNFKDFVTALFNHVYHNQPYPEIEYVDETPGAQVGSAGPAPTGQAKGPTPSTASKSNDILESPELKKTLSTSGISGMLNSNPNLKAKLEKALSVMPSFMRNMITKNPRKLADYVKKLYGEMPAKK